MIAYIFRNSLLVAMVTNQMKRYNKNAMLGGGPMNEHFSKTFVKISALK